MTSNHQLLVAGSTASRGGSERGIALVVALLAMMLMTALGMALMLTSQTETLIGSNFRDSMEGNYVADAGIERVMQDVLSIPDWNTVLTSPDGVRAGVTSGFVDGGDLSSIQWDPLESTCRHASLSIL